MKTKLIAEIGVNHGGDLGTAKSLIDMAVLTGCDYVKFQKRNPRISTPRGMWEQPKDTPWGTIEPYIVYRERAEFGKNEYNVIDAYCMERGISWFASAWDVDSVDFLAQYNCPFIKIPSAKALDTILLQHSIATGARVIVSTGMMDATELTRIVAHIPRGRGHVIMVCHSEYPVSDDRELNLRQIEMYRNSFPGLSIGFSSHSDSPFPAIYSKFFGAEIVEVHITKNRSLKWGDNSASLEYDGLALVSREFLRIDRISGDGEKRLYPSELQARLKLRGY